MFYSLAMKSILLETRDRSLEKRSSCSSVSRLGEEYWSGYKFLRQGGWNVFDSFLIVCFEVLVKDFNKEEKSRGKLFSFVELEIRWLLSHIHFLERFP